MAHDKVRLHLIVRREPAVKHIQRTVLCAQNAHLVAAILRERVEPGFVSGFYRAVVQNCVAEIVHGRRPVPVIGIGVGKHLNAVFQRADADDILLGISLRNRHVDDLLHIASGFGLYNVAVAHARRADASGKASQQGGAKDQCDDFFHKKIALLFLTRTFYPTNL